MKVHFNILLLSLFSIFQAKAQETIIPEDTLSKKGAISELKYIKQSGFANASSKIFSAEQRFTISGFGEVNYVNYDGTISNKNSKEIEQYYSNLYRTGVYFGYKISDKFIAMSEVQMEYLHDGTHEGHFEANVEVSLDYLLDKHFNIRVGNYPLNLGWVNVNEEPIAFYTVNRPEVERTIIPSQWLEQGILFYGELIPDTEYQFGITKGMRGQDFTSGTWIRNGRYTNWTEWPPTVAFNGKLGYGHEDRTLLSIAGYYGDASGGYSFSEGAMSGQSLDSNLGLLTVTAAHNIGGFTLFGLYAKGWLSGTDQIYQINNEIVGAETVGYYLEGRYDIMPFINKASDWKLPVFVRYEGMNTHQKIDSNLKPLIGQEGVVADPKDLEIISVGFNVRPKKNWTFKANYQFRNNRYADAPKEQNQFELGVGFIF
ncbi:hypothetical protein KEM09_13000 [Carboxylicivirga mesophila]|uniref:Porin n=1 Tax=Carboxylicivirga mesophila TaxID=1166478 RepID=A0ABS5KBW0_9BACT|nr:hypothetical protein [Carboxylicivirga mesophila]MBS2212327.1 hypothetical protein [Carboxylicivirga mesophila]